MKKPKWKDGDVVWGVWVPEESRLNRHDEEPDDVLDVTDYFGVFRGVIAPSGLIDTLYCNVKPIPGDTSSRPPWMLTKLLYKTEAEARKVFGLWCVEQAHELDKRAIALRDFGNDQLTKGKAK